MRKGAIKTVLKDYKEFLSCKYPDVINEYEEFVGVYDNEKIAWSNIEDALSMRNFGLLKRIMETHQK